MTAVTLASRECPKVWTDSLFLMSDLYCSCEFSGVAHCSLQRSQYHNLEAPFGFVHEHHSIPIQNPLSHKHIWQDEMQGILGYWKA